MQSFDPEGRIVCDKSVKLNSYQPREFVPYETLSDQELITNAGGDLIVDCEFYPNYFLIAFKHIVSGRFFTMEQQDFNPSKLAWIMQSYRTIGFNSIKFDIPLIWLAHNCPLPQVLKEAANKLILEEMKPRQLQAEYNF